MENRVGDNNPSVKQVEKWVGELRATMAEMAPHTLSLTLDEVKSTLKMRAGGEKIAPLLAELSKRYKLQIPGVDMNAMQSDLTLAERLRPLVAVIDELAARVQHTTLEAESEAWWAATATYTALSGLARSDAELQSALAPATDFFARRRRLPKPPVAK